MLDTRFKIYFLFFLLLLNINLAKAQLGKEAWHWQFGQNASLDFSSGTPVTGTCAINTNEGSASISDPNTGQLLFYTDGTSAWDKNNNQMPNGFGMIGGQGTSTQAALIVPKPGSSTIYYLISADQGGYCCPGNPMANQGVNYSIVDMSLNGGLGDVTIKNQPLTPPPTTEKLTAVRHCNGTDYWIITHPFNSNSFNAYLLTSSGINLTPVVSNVGTVQTNISGTEDETIGYLKSSTNGRKLAMAVYNYLNFVEVFDFDNSTGVITNPIKINYITSGYGAYGVAFSSDNTKLYTTEQSNGIFQYDLTSNNAATILASQINIFPGPNNSYMGDIQLAPDGKIYVILYNSVELGIINNPNNPGLSCNFQLNGLALATGTENKNGLPNFIEANNPFRSQSYNVPLCSFPNYTLTATGNSHYHWLTGDTTQSILINSFGDYWVAYTNTQGCKEIDTFHVTQTTPPVINILHDTGQCSNLITPVTINATYSNTTFYDWNDGSTSPVHTITIPGNYWVDYTLSDFCVSRDSFAYLIHNIPLVDLGNDTTFCLGDLPLNAFNNSSHFIWSTGQTTPGIIVTSPNTYWVKVINQYGCINSDTLIVHPQLDAFNFILPNIVTPNNDQINDFIDFGKYQFSSLQIEIYNRWGKKVFESTDPTCVWKPTEDPGTYFLTAIYQIDCGSNTQIKSLKGFITLLK